MEISLNYGRVALIDDAFTILENVKWRDHKVGSGLNVQYYAVRDSLSSRRIMYMHRIIVGCILGRLLTRIEEIDHIDHNGLNNQLTNLRVVNRHKNRYNQRTRGGNKSSQYKGVYYHKVAEKWQAQCFVSGQSRYLGLFKSEEDAARAYDMVAKIAYGSFAALNFPEES